MYSFLSRFFCVEGTTVDGIRAAIVGYKTDAKPLGGV